MIISKDVATIVGHIEPSLHCLRFQRGPPQNVTKNMKNNLFRDLYADWMRIGVQIF